MTWTTWIHIEPEDTENEAVRDLYRRTRNEKTGKLSDTARLTSLTPDVAGRIYDLNKAIGQATKSLTLRESEIAALLVAVNIGCVH